MMAADESADEVFSLRTLRKRGRLKVFLGYAPGVGKTFSMLAEAHRRVSRGEDLVIGFVETHGRRETAELVEGLEQVPLKRLEYRGKSFEELDTAAVIARRPEWVLIDEMAHTNVPGTTHEKRWQSVEEILTAGISVITTINVQHFESLNDTVLEITGVRVQETLPDAVLDQAEEVVLVDLTTSALLNRLKRGVVYDLDKIPGALANFFKRENLVALRELALRKTAEEVDDSLERIIAGDEAIHPWTTEERIIVCVRPGPVAAKLIRRGHRLAKRFQGRFWVVYVRTPGQLGGSGRRQVESLFELARELGGETEELSADSLGDEILRFAREKRATFIVMGQSRRSRVDEIVRGSLIARIIREIDHVDVLVVADPSKALPVQMEE
ncbi:MAG: universal stress protein [Actinobacteria bacterium]|nr:universal stress protein [Actinomycetota bacterium]